LGCYYTIPDALVFPSFSDKKKIIINLDFEDFHHNNGRIASFCCWSSSQTGSGIELPNLLLPQFANSTQIHLWIGMEFLCNVSSQSAHKGFSSVFIKKH
jgi:hypothetical protein